VWFPRYDCEQTNKLVQLQRYLNFSPEVGLHRGEQQQLLDLRGKRCRNSVKATTGKANNDENEKRNEEEKGTESTSIPGVVPSNFSAVVTPMILLLWAGQINQSISQSVFLSGAATARTTDG